MRFALLGADDDTLALARAVAADSDHELASAHDVPTDRVPELWRQFPRLSVVESWESLLSGEVADVVIAARAATDDPRAEQLRRLAQAGVPLVVAHPVVDSMLVYYELDMIRQDGHSILFPFAPHYEHPALRRLVEFRDLAADGPLGAVQQVLIERFAAERGRRDVLAAFVRDMALARRLVGELDKLGAMTTPGGESEYANLGLQMSGPGGVVVRWSIGPIEERSGARFTLVGQRGKAVWHAPEGDSASHIELRGDAGRTIEHFEGYDGARAFLQRFATPQLSVGTQPTWVDAAHDMEMADAIDRSLKRGRTIDLYFDEQTEEGTFKGMMAAGGCVLLLVSLVATILSAVLARWVPAVRYLAYVMLALLAVFLLLQLLRLAFPRTS